MIKVIQFNPQHLNLMELRNTEREGAFSLPDFMERMDVVTKGSVQAATFLLDGKILFAAGFHQLWPGVLEVWMVPAACIKTAPMLFGRMIKRYVDNIAVDFKAHRIQTTSHDDPFHERWMNFLGFQKEGTLRAFTYDKKPMCIYSRIA